MEEVEKENENKEIVGIIEKGMNKRNKRGNWEEEKIVKIGKKEGNKDKIKIVWNDGVSMKESKRRMKGDIGEWRDNIEIKVEEGKKNEWGFNGVWLIFGIRRWR